MIPLGVLAGSRHVPAAGGGSLYRDEVLADSPLVYLRLDESSGPPVDYGSLGVTPTALNAWPTWGGTGIGDGDSSAGFPASIGVGIGVGLINQIGSSSPATVEALIRVDSLAAVRVILARSATNARFQVSATGSLQYLGGPWPTTVQSPPGVISTATTYHVAATLTGTNCTLYVNGSTVGSGAAGTAGTGDSSWSVGRAPAPGYELPFAGHLAGVAIYDTTLTAARILAHAQAAGVA